MYILKDCYLNCSLEELDGVFVLFEMREAVSCGAPRLGAVVLVDGGELLREGAQLHVVLQVPEGRGVVLREIQPVRGAPAHVFEKSEM